MRNHATRQMQGRIARSLQTMAVAQGKECKKSRAHSIGIRADFSRAKGESKYGGLVAVRKAFSFKDIEKSSSNHGASSSAEEKPLHAAMAAAGPCCNKWQTFVNHCSVNRMPKAVRPKGYAAWETSPARFRHRVGLIVGETRPELYAPRR